MRKWLFCLVACSLPGWGELPAYDQSRARPLDAWKPQIAEYSRRHYGEAQWQLKPRCIVLHYTAGASFPWNLVRSRDFAGETPGLASHYVVENAKIYQLLPPTVRSRAAFGINHRAINIEMVGADESDMMARRTQTMNTAARLVVDLMREFSIPLEEIYSHEQVATMDKAVVPWVLDLVNPAPYHKLDPGEGPMEYILQRVRSQFP
jgi:N-acetyl-anhydromuramyl-L-alanine amidase AmpD